MRFARRPWGWWLVLYQAKHFKLKLLRFHKGGQLSLQKHKYRSELWLFLRGTGKFYHRPQPKRGDYILVRPFTLHQYTAETPTWVLEVQFGQCDESDIERIDEQV